MNETPESILPSNVILHLNIVTCLYVLNQSFKLVSSSRHSYNIIIIVNKAIMHTCNLKQDNCTVQCLQDHKANVLLSIPEYTRLSVCIDWPSILHICMLKPHSKTQGGMAVSHTLIQLHVPILDLSSGREVGYLFTYT